MSAALHHAGGSYATRATQIARHGAAADWPGARIEVQAQDSPMAYSRDLL